MHYQHTFSNEEFSFVEPWPQPAGSADTGDSCFAQQQADLDPPRKHRPRRSAAARREQQRRSDTRTICKVLQGLASISGHRGNQLSDVGIALRDALTSKQAQHGTPSRSQMPLCRHWALGKCTFGNSCRFRHGHESHIVEVRGSDTQDDWKHYGNYSDNLARRDELLEQSDEYHGIDDQQARKDAHFEQQSHRNSNYDDDTRRDILLEQQLHGKVDDNLGQVGSPMQDLETEGFSEPVSTIETTNEPELDIQVVSTLHEERHAEHVKVEKNIGTQSLECDAEALGDPTIQCDQTASCDPISPCDPTATGDPIVSCGPTAFSGPTASGEPTDPLGSALAPCAFLSRSRHANSMRRIVRGQYASVKVVGKRLSGKQQWTPNDAEQISRDIAAIESFRIDKSCRLTSKSSSMLWKPNIDREVLSDTAAIFLEEKDPASITLGELRRGLEDELGLDRDNLLPYKEDIKEICAQFFNSKA